MKHTGPAHRPPTVAEPVAFDVTIRLYSHYDDDEWIAGYIQDLIVSHPTMCIPVESVRAGKPPQVEMSFIELHPLAAKVLALMAELGPDGALATYGINVDCASVAGKDDEAPLDWAVSEWALDGYPLEGAPDGDWLIREAAAELRRRGFPVTAGDMEVCLPTLDVPG